LVWRRKKRKKILILKFNIETLPAEILPVFFSQKSFGRQKIKHNKNRKNI